MATKSVRLSSADAVLFPDEGITKGDLFEYYGAIAPAFVPHLRDRPFTMKRSPYGVSGESYSPEAGAEGHAGLDPDAHLPHLARARAARGSSTSRSSTRRRRCSGWCR